MPQLDIVTYFSQFIYLLISFITIYYFVIVFIIPNTVTASKLRAKFNSTTLNETGKNIEKINLLGEDLLDNSFNAADLNLASKSCFSFSVEDLKIQNKAGQQNMKSALMLYFPSLLANKKRLIFSELL